jgi:enoyl-CoA hydratase/carnithine racemase
LAEGPVLVERPGEGIAKVTLNNPPLNLVTLEMTEQLIEALEELEGDEAVRAIVVTGAGDRAFCAGSDVKEFAEVRDSVVQKKLASEAERLGLVKEVVPDGEALPRALDVARSISRQPKEAVAAIKRGVRESLHSGREDSIRLTLELSDHVFRTEDCAEGILAFCEKREARSAGAPGTGDEVEV